MIRPTLLTLMNTTMGQILHRASISNLSMALVARSLPQVSWELEGRQQRGQILLRAPQQLGILGLPAEPELLERSPRDGLAGGLIDTWASRFISLWVLRRTASYGFRLLCTQRHWCRPREYTAGIAAVSPVQPSVIINCKRWLRNPRRYRSFGNPSSRLAFALGSNAGDWRRPWVRTLYATKKNTFHGPNARRAISRTPTSIR